MSGDIKRIDRSGSSLVNIPVLLSTGLYGSFLTIRTDYVWFRYFLATNRFVRVTIEQYSKVPIATFLVTAVIGGFVMSVFLSDDRSEESPVLPHKGRDSSSLLSSE